MCAIMGVLDRKAPVNIDIMQSMQRILQHRGPDDSGIEMLDMAWPSSKSYPYIGVAFDRLSIRDLSMAGHQPMWDEKREVMVAMNGEVYNTGELTEDLQQRNIKLHSNSDVEVLLNVYLVYGIEEALRKLDGMFAICLIDKRQQKIYLVRDRIGEKPLYLYEDNDRLMFASEYKAFYCHPEFRAELNRDLVSEYFLFRFSSSGETFLKGVRNMRPGSYLEISSNGVKERVYWQLPRPVKANRTFKQSKDELKRLIIQSTKRRLISDRAIGMQLSGGVDSSYLCWVVKNELQEDLDSYSIGFEDENCDESKYVDIVNRRLNLKSHKIVYRPKDFLASWEEATWYFEAPMNHEGTLALLQLNRMASKNVTVMLCGDGPDECMGGYSRFHRVDRYLRRRHGITWMANKWIELRKGNSHYRSLDDYFISQSQYMSDEAFRQLFPETYKCEMRNVYRRRKKLLRQFNKGEGMRRYLNYEMNTYMQDILMRTDKISMASSLEVRVPYLMPELLEYIQTIPETYLVDYKKPLMHGTKIVLKELCAEEFGADFAYRNKFGLGMPMLHFFKDHGVRQYVEEKLFPTIEKRGIIDYNYMRKVWNEVMGSTEFGDERVRILWLIFSFEIWAKIYIDDSPVNQKQNIINEHVENHRIH